MDIQKAKPNCTLEGGRGYTKKLAANIQYQCRMVIY